MTACPHRINPERALAADAIPWSVAVEAEGWPLTVHFAAPASAWPWSPAA